jgi:hypothetical protein
MADTSSNNPLTPPMDMSDVATKSGLLAEYQARGNAGGSSSDMFNDVFALRDARSNLTTNNSGVWTKTYTAGVFTRDPSINVNPSTSAGGAGQLGWRTTKSKDANGAWTITVTFTMIPLSLNISLGALTLGANPGVVTFDYQAFESLA